MCVSTQLQECAWGAPRDHKKAVGLLELELQTVESCLKWVLGTNLGPPKEQPLLLIVESSLQPFPQSFV